jgi:hypothetical protein
MIILFDRLFTGASFGSVMVMWQPFMPDESRP